MPQLQNPFADNQKRDNLPFQGKQRLSPFLFVELAGALFIPIGVFFILIKASDHVAAIPAIMIFLSIMIKLIPSVAKYFIFTWELGEVELIIEEGMFNKIESHYPYEKIQSVNLKTSGFQRILGFTALEFTDASSKKISIAPLNRGIAELLKQEIYVRKQENKEQVSISQREQRVVSKADTVNKFSRQFNSLEGLFEESVSKIKELYNRQLNHWELVIVSLGDLSAWFPLAISWILISKLDRLLSMVGIDIYSLLSNAYSTHKDEAFSFIKLHVLSVFAAFLLCYLVGLFIQFCYNYLQHSSYMLKRHKKSFEISKGFFSQSVQTVSFSKIQGLMYEQNLFYKLIGYVSVKALVIEAGEDDTKGFVLIHPCLRKSVLSDFLADFTPELSDFSELDQYKLASSARRRAYVRTSIYNLFLVAIIALIDIFAAFFLADFTLFDYPEFNIIFAYMVMVIATFVGVVWLVRNYLNADIRARNSWFAYDSQKLVFHVSGIKDKVVVLSKKKLQDVCISQTLFQVRAQVGKLEVNIAGSVSDFDINDVIYEDTLKFLEWMYPYQDNNPEALKVLKEEDLLYEEEELHYAQLCEQGSISCGKDVEHE